MQAISDTEGEITRRQVQINSAGKQAEKLTKECSKTQQELDKTAADLQAKQKEQEVTRHLGTLQTCTQAPSKQVSAAACSKEAIKSLMPAALITWI